MQGERVPLFPADAKYLNQLITFITDVKARDKWMKLATGVIKRNEELLATIGNADEIDKLHAEAAELKAVVLKGIEKREKALAEDWEKFDAERVKRRTTMQREEHDAGARATRKTSEATRLLSGAKQKDEAASKALKDAEKAREQAQDERDRVKNLRAELEAQRARVTELAGAVAG